jgi:hypothetical protein
LKTRILAVLGLSALLTTGAAFARDEKQGQAAGQTATHSRSADVTYGRVKEMTAGQKVVIDVDNAMDKSYDLTDKDMSMKMASGLKVGDPVKITETDRNGKKMVNIVKDRSAHAKHGDKTRSEEVKTSDKDKH